MTLAPLINSLPGYDLLGSLVRDEVLALIIFLFRVCILKGLTKGHFGAMTQRWGRNA